MKKTQEILGLPIISISDGMEVGRVKSVIINADKGAIDYVVVDSGIQILSARVISTENVLGIGEYALTIENDGVVNDISKIPAAIDLLQKNVQVKGTKVLTKKGRLIGEIGDIYIDEDDCCKITGLEYIADITQKRVRIIPRTNVITFGKNLVVVSDDVENALVDKAAQLGTEDKPAEAEKKNLVIFDTDNLSSTDTAIQNGELTEEDTREETYETVDTGYRTEEEQMVNASIEEVMTQESDMETAGCASGDGNTPANLFEQRQRQYIIGRRSTKTISDNAGNIIVNEGTLINDEIIDLVKASGKLVELVMNNKA